MSELTRRRDISRNEETWLIFQDVARELRRRCDLQMRELPSTISDFVERNEDRDRRQLTLRLV
jgi:hypothetical protein